MKSYGNFNIHFWHIGIIALCKPASSIINSICRGDQCGEGFGNDNQNNVESVSIQADVCRNNQNICGIGGKCITAYIATGR